MSNYYEAKNPSQPWSIGDSIYVPTILQGVVRQLIAGYRERKSRIIEQYPDIEAEICEILKETLEMRGIK